MKSTLFCIRKCRGHKSVATAVLIPFVLVAVLAIATSRTSLLDAFYGATIASSLGASALLIRQLLQGER